MASPATTAVSFVLPPKVTRQVLEAAKEVGVKAVWLQPGSFDEEGLNFAKDNFETAVGGTEEGTIGPEGWCVMADGEATMERAGIKWTKQEL